ncbi:MCE family protein [Stenotrophomonas sp. Sa5BUN4]|jgi:phospholipid/cholesterol/gamma-HCH transport system substrate-binding protein|uniref:MCE family protein n=1 Tax=Stenotrophomonas lacuserhaii TaxID=2760084 RepID=A0A8X8K3Q3_9GAMM|nr:MULTISPECIES: MlaD family protein [Stenotrophomonas]KIP86144.1 ABC transporter substrate-binding protein [Stenotrophomonas maltophilia]MBD7955285.1 MCE family protein [Stenotrophomonas pennii]MBD8644308.1 MCE family protein [Stenotrophomonas sp. CFBP 13724]MDX3933065.1 MlaD family protein [Stenotrophomonas sp.]MDY1033735.1 MlaD family protein [Stenotrophomonas sp. CFBP8980]
METKANYVLIGAFTLITGLALLAFGLWAAKYSSDRTWQEYRVVFREAVTGLTVGSPVQYNGIAVGSIIELNLVPDDPRQVVAKIRLNSTTPVKTDTRAKLAITSLTGPSIIQLSGGTPQSPTLTSVNRDPAPIIPTTPSALQNITDVANRIVERMDQVLSDRNVAAINATLANIESISGGLADQKQGTQALLLSARNAARSLDETLKTTNGTIQRLDQNLVQELPGIIEKLDATMTKMDSAAGNANSILGENRAAINSFASDGLGQLGPTLTELRGLIRDLRRVSDRLENNPARYLLGRDAPKEFEPE